MTSKSIRHWFDLWCSRPLFLGQLHLTYNFQVDKQCCLPRTKKINKSPKSLIIHVLIMQVKYMDILQRAIYELKLINANNRIE